MFGLEISTIILIVLGIMSILGGVVTFKGIRVIGLLSGKLSRILCVIEEISEDKKWTTEELKKLASTINSEILGHKEEKNGNGDNTGN